MKLATVTTRESDGKKIYTLGPIRLLRPIHRLMWHMLYNKLHWHWVYRWLWRRYREEC